MIDWILFFLACAVLLLLPMIPALLEWRHPQDAEPLKVVRAYDGNIHYFAHSFRDFLAESFPGLLPAAPAQVDGSRPRRLAAADVQMVAAGAAVQFSAAALAERSCAQLLLSPGALVLGDDMLYEKELYAGADLAAGQRNTFRAILAHGDIALGDESTILRWAHSDASLRLGAGAKLYGRVSADVSLTLPASCRFGRMWAPLIQFGAGAIAPLEPVATLPLARPSDLLDETPYRWLVAGTLEVPAGTSHQGALVAARDVRIGAGAHLRGDIKSNGDLLLADGVRVDGSLVATGTISIGRGCIVKGPVVCDRVILIGSDSVVGNPASLTTVSAAEIRISEGTSVHGTVWARELGFVAPRKAGAA